MTEQPIGRVRQTISLELETDLRLHPLRQQLGRAELLTEALTRPYDEIENQLRRYVTGASAEEAELLRKNMKRYLGKLNASSRIPLDFRLKVLNRFEQELNLFDGEMTAAVLNAHKIGVELVQQAARDNPAFYGYLLDMVANAIELAIRLLRQSLEQYRSPAVIAIRQFFDLARLGLSVAIIPDEALHPARQRLYKAICNHEFLRSLDFFGKTGEQQQMTWQELQRHVNDGQPHFCRGGEPAPELSGRAFLISNVNRPHERARVVERLPEPLINDSIVIPLDEFLKRLHGAMSRVRNVLQSSDAQQTDLHTEDALETTLVGGAAIITALQSGERNVRQTCSAGIRIVLEWDAARAFVIPPAAAGRNDGPPPGHADSWSAVDISQGGVGLERAQGQPLPSNVGALVGLKWLGSKGGMPTLGFVRWFREPKAGEQRLGIEFLKGRFQPARCTILGGSSDLSSLRTWPLLIRPGKESVTAIFPFANTPRNMTFSLAYNHEEKHCKVAGILHAGPNATICSIVQAESSDIRKHGHEQGGEAR